MGAEFVKNGIKAIRYSERIHYPDDWTFCAHMHDCYHMFCVLSHALELEIGGQVYRKGKVYRTMVDKTTGKLLNRELLRENHALVLYDTDGLELTIEEDCTESTVGRE